MQSIPEDSRQGAVRREWPSPFSRTATPDWILWDAPFGRAGKRSPAVLRLWARAKAIPCEARLALNRFPTRCIRHYYLDRVLADEANRSQHNGFHERPPVSRVHSRTCRFSGNAIPSISRLMIGFIGQSRQSLNSSGKSVDFCVNNAYASPFTDVLMY